MTNPQMHEITAWQTFYFYIPEANLTIYQNMFITRVSIFTTIHQNLLKIYLQIEINFN